MNAPSPPRRSQAQAPSPDREKASKDLPWVASLLPSFWNACTCGSRSLSAERTADQAMVAPKHDCTSSRGATYDYEGWQDSDFEQVAPPWEVAFGEDLEPQRVSSHLDDHGGTDSGGSPTTIDDDARPQQPPPEVQRETLARIGELGNPVDAGACSGQLSRGEALSVAVPPAVASPIKLPRGSCSGSVREAIAAASLAALPAGAKERPPLCYQLGSACEPDWLADQPECVEAPPAWPYSAGASAGADLGEMSQWPRHVAVASVAAASTTAFVVAAAGAFPVAAAAGTLGFALGILSSVLGIRVGRWVG
mmetsp:Transcript_49894/g.141321  ORF Transcript_49894/g.141321 Transcript_49894/m.141321 type:complete len:308 (-) Transcript_49894:68-991(-)|eukprot:CAMPEP_0177307068 /NCGR_PEP_ID=MMETSP0368-20130122/8050_1 /TAXON_ID=447022 ORGANISM="Scrippsiella hangoei-like, Strain SHHI-4" /NCGR_SAMPLE_ID=MMETSP0368 /ASSEMBLY_ACC=CAM_ASM_000363 /LENGTH=307 /DNA_ID=CAMNT_0018765819 /DNA_START=184 /DNA_END=1107 /DNA_ORIENTATION=+